MSTSNEFYVGPFLLVESNVRLSEAVYDMEAVKEDTFIDCFSEERHRDPGHINVWISNLVSDNLLRDDSSGAVLFNGTENGFIADFKRRFAEPLAKLTENGVKYTVEFGAVSYWS